MNMTWNPEEYAAHSKGQAIWAKELIKKIDLSGDESILDIGCGDGKITDYLNTYTSGEVIGIDVNPEMITYAQNAFSKPCFIVMDAQTITFEERFDVVFSNAALHWVKDHHALLQGIYRALKPGGKVVMQMGGHGNAKEVFSVLNKVMKRYGEYFNDFEPPYIFHTDSDYEEMLKNGHFSHYCARLIPKDMVHESIDAFRGWLETTWFPFINCVPEEKREAFVVELCTTYLECHAADVEGKIHVSMVRLEVLAVK